MVSGVDKHICQHQNGGGGSAKSDPGVETHVPRVGMTVALK